MQGAPARCSSGEGSFQYRAPEAPESRGDPGVAGEPVEHVAAERMPLRKRGMVEVVRGIVGHAELLHDPARAQVGGRGEGDELGQIESAKGMANDGLRAFIGKSPAPVRRGKAPADFDAGRESCLKARNGEADIADELALLAGFGGPEAEAVAGEVRFDAVDELAGLLLGERRREKFHDNGVGVETGEWRTVVRPPGAKEKTVGAERGEDIHG